MSSGLDIKNLFHVSRQVGKTIKSSKKCYRWEFNLNNKYHKVEMFNSKLSGKKKLVLDGQLLTEAKTYSNEFSYSFKIDNHYFNVDQMGADKFDLRIDNRSFSAIQSELKPNPKVDAKAGAAKPSIRNNSLSKANPRNREANFFNENDFEFDDPNKSTQNNDQQSHTFENPNPGKNNTAINSTKLMQPAEQSQNVGLLIDFGQPEKIENNKNQETGIFSQMQFDNNNNPNNQQQTQDTYNHNNQVLNNLNINFGGNCMAENLQNANNNGDNNNNNNKNSNFNPLIPMNNIENSNTRQVPFMQNTNVINDNNLGSIPTENINAIGGNINNCGLNTNQLTSNNSNYCLQNPNDRMSPSSFNNNNSGLDGNIKLPSENAGNNNKGSLLQNYGNNAFSFTNLNNFNFNEPQNIYTNNKINDNKDLVQQQPEQKQPPEQNQFKDKILGNGLINLENLLEDNEISNKKPSQPQTTYKFDLSGPKLEINPNTLNNNPINLPNVPKMNVNMNNPYQYNINQGYRMQMQPQPMMSQQMNPNMYMMNNFSQMPMNLGYPHQQQFSNYHNAGFNQNMGYNMQPPISNQKIPQQNKTNNTGSVLDFF